MSAGKFKLFRKTLIIEATRETPADMIKLVRETLAEAGQHGTEVDDLRIVTAHSETVLQVKHTEIWRSSFLSRENIVARMVSAVQKAPVVTHAQPPTLGETILSFVYRGEQLEAVLGDFEERFHKLAASGGMRLARAWYWWQVVRSAAAFTLRWGRKLGPLAEIVRRLT